MKFVTSLLVCFGVCACALAQTGDFITSGMIEYERRLLQRNAGSPNPVLNLTYFNLEFEGGKTMYQPVVTNKYLSPDVANDNLVFSNYTMGIRVALKNIFEKRFSVADSIPRTIWKLTNEKKIIAGVECKRANGIILDSIYVVAFYTEVIDVTGGPESFSGLPGMILGISVPHEHVSWFATKIQRFLPPRSINTMTVSKEQNVSQREFSNYVQAALAGWGPQAHSMLIQSLL